MPQPERRPVGPRSPEGGTPSPEAALPRYHQAARFAGEELAQVTYFTAQDIVFAHAGDVDLSAYRMQLSRVDHVVILGDPPPADLHEQLRTVLAAGEPAVVPEDVLRLLNARRTVATTAGPWGGRTLPTGQAAHLAVNVVRANRCASELAFVRAALPAVRGGYRADQGHHVD